MRKIKCVFVGLVLLFSFSSHSQKTYTLSSPGRNIEIKIEVGDSIHYSITSDQLHLINRSAVDFRIDKIKDKPIKVKRHKNTSVNNILYPVVAQKSSIVKDRYNQLRLDLSNGLSLEWRAYDNGVAWHWISSLKEKYNIDEEIAEFNLDKNGRSWYPQEDGFYSHNERQYRNYRIDSIDDNKLASLPVLFEVKGTKLLITESGLFNYAGMWLKGKGNGILTATFPGYPKKLEVTSDRDQKVIEREDYIAQVEGSQSFPWRIIMIAKEDKDILNNQLVYQLAPEATGDYSWVKPGKVQWDWWHYNNIYGVDFRAGINTATYKYYIDFASKYNIEYVLLDEGWCDTRDLLKVSPDIDMKELSRYAKEKKVDLLLWTSWLVLDKQLDTALDLFSSWGIKGIKVDFMQRDDQLMVNYYERVSKAAAKRKMLVDFHGAYKPTGWLRTLPNVLTSEGVFGNEISKFASPIDPEHTTTLPFTRMAAGPMDFTPGGMINVQKNAFAAVPSEPMTLGTRANQLAMYVIYESPLQMLCDLPTHYYKEPESMEFLSHVPTQWKQTIPLKGKVGDFVAIARQALNGDWYIGAMSDWDPRKITIDLDFLDNGSYQLQSWKDGINADRNAKDCKMEKQTVDKKTRLELNMARGGGYVARIVKL